MREIYKNHGIYFEIGLKKLKNIVYSIYENRGNDISSDEVIFYTHSCLHSLLDYWERLRIIPHTNFDSDTINLLNKAFRFATDQLKHERSLVSITKVEHGVRYPYTYPKIYNNRTFTWIKINECERHKDRFIMYKKLLEGKDVVKTFEYAKTILDYAIIA